MAKDCPKSTYRASKGYSATTTLLDSSCSLVLGHNWLTLEAGFMIVRMVMGKGCIMVVATPPDFSVSDRGFFFFGQGG